MPKHLENWIQLKPYNDWNFSRIELILTKTRRTLKLFCPLLISWTMCWRTHLNCWYSSQSSSSAPPGSSWRKFRVLKLSLTNMTQKTGDDNQKNRSAVWDKNILDYLQQSTIYLCSGLSNLFVLVSTTLTWCRKNGVSEILAKCWSSCPTL